MKSMNNKKDMDKLLLKLLFIIVIVEVIMIVSLICIGVRKTMPLMLLIVPTIIAAVAMLILARNSLFQSRKQNKKVSIKINA